ncbi:hypothetical protein [Deinococcus cellulosilyticus]|uniref:Uncharacterized protein n=1 Tax=Deinococcus cellulosilyticus (strain DSM 18568 / NBRC 106333 / KACC 11606 / 5516J-15) TaxID=1223518 RepID=A0A511MVB6_DEIC1|nr:hypothetical protein [Deinococcus cellulosilyticus]GEM44524.1 hypothetical protein DC3_01590 [Deinococcus cellulosilyticus NBRC 106333 = KACC 11606]
MEASLKIITEDGPEWVEADRIFALVEGGRPHTCYVHLRAIGKHSHPRMLVVEEDLPVVDRRLQRCLNREQGVST